MKRILFNREGNAWGVVAAAACVAGGYGLLEARRLQLRRRAAWPSQRIVIVGGSRGLGFLLAREFVGREIGSKELATRHGQDC